MALPPFIPTGSTAVGSARGKLFDATLYELPDGSCVAYVYIDPDASQPDLATDGITSKINSAAKRAGKKLQRYIIDRSVWPPPP